MGPFQNVPLNRSREDRGGAHAAESREVYEDVAVIAYRLPLDDRSVGQMKPVVTSSAGSIDAGLLWDGDFNKPVTLPLEHPDKPAWIQFDFEHAQTIQSMAIAMQGWSGMDFFVDPSQLAGKLQCSDDGVQFRDVVAVRNTADVQQTLTFTATSARYFRLLLFTVPLPPKAVVRGFPPANEHNVTELVLYPVPRVNRFEQKAAFFASLGDVSNGLDRPPTPDVFRTGCCKELRCPGLELAIAA